MDEELEQRGVTPESFFDQATETREKVQAVQKTSNSNLSLLNELKERVRKIEVKLFDEEDKRQKEEMEARVKEQNEKTQGGNLGDKGGVKDPEQKGLMGQVGSFLSNLVGGLVGGTIGFTLSGIGGMIGGAVGLGKKALDLGKNLREKLFGKKEDKKGGKVNTDKFLGVVGGKDDEKKKKEDDKNLIKEEIKQELGLGDRLKETGGKILGGIKKTFGGIKDAISNFDGRPGSRKTKNTGTVIKKEVKESTSIPKGKETSFADALSGNRDTIHQFLFERRMESQPIGEGFNDFSGNPAYDSDVDTFLRGLKDSPQGYGIEINRGRVYLSKEKAVDGGYSIGRDNLPLDKLQESDNAMYGDTFPAGSFSAPKKNTYARAMLEFNEGGVVQKFNQGGEVDSVPAMLTPGEFVVTKDAVKKVGVNTLKGLNASVGATNKPTLMKGTTDSFLGSMSAEFGGFNEDGSIKTIEKSMRMTGEGLEKTYFDGTTDIYELSSDDEYFHSKDEMIGAGMSSETISKYKNTETTDDGTESTFSEEVRTKDFGVSIGVPDLIEHKNQLMSEINKLKGFEKVTFDQFMKKEHGIPQELLLPILYRSDASKATAKKIDRANKLDMEKGVKPASAYGNSLGYRKNQLNPARYTSFDNNMTYKTEDRFSVASGFNQGGLVTPIIESRGESGEMELINNLSQLVEGNSQNINVIQAQNAAMNPPNKNPQTTVPVEPSNTTFTGLQDTDAPIPFAALLRQNAQRYLNLGNNAMVIS